MWLQALLRHRRGAGSCNWVTLPKWAWLAPAPWAPAWRRYSRRRGTRCSGAIARPRGLQRGLSRIRDNQSLLIRHGALNVEEADAALSRLHPTEDLADLAGVQLVSESIAEDLPAKQALFRALDARCGGATIFTTNTSGLSISRLAEAASRPDRFAGLHCANPAHIIPVAEIIKGEDTADATCEVLTALAYHLGKRPVLVQREVPGFIANRFAIRASA